MLVWMNYFPQSPGVRGQRHMEVVWISSVAALVERKPWRTRQGFPFNEEISWCERASRPLTQISYFYGMMCPYSSMIPGSAKQSPSAQTIVGGIHVEWVFPFCSPPPPSSIPTSPIVVEAYAWKEPTPKFSFSTIPEANYTWEHF